MFRVFGVLVGFFPYYLGFSEPESWGFLPTGSGAYYTCFYLYQLKLAIYGEDNILEYINNFDFLTTG